MGAVKIVDQLLYPGVTPLLRQTHGPVAYMGEVITNVHVFLSEAEVREATHAFGGITKDEADELNASYAALDEENVALRAELAAYKELGDAMDKVYRHKRTKIANLKPAA